MPATRLAAMVRERKVSPVELADAHIARIEEVNGALNAMIADRFEAARGEARVAEAAVMAGAELPPLHGVPCTIKEFLRVTGMPHTGGGLLARRDVVASADATVVTRLRDAGAIILGVTNAPEGGMWMETYNKVYGRTNNPWDLKRTPGGSSGGEAALVASGASPFGLGSDIAGSIRIPSAFCGVFGHKPTGRMVPNTGHWGPETGGTRSKLVCGPIGRSVADLAAVLPIIAGPDGIDGDTREWPALERPAGDLSGVVVYPVEVSAGTLVRESMRRQVRRAAAALAERGAEIRPLESRYFKHALLVWGMGMREANAGAASFAEILGDGTAINLGLESLRTLVGRSRVTFPALALAVLEQLSSYLPERLTARAPRPDQLSAELESILGGNGVILHPPYTRPAPLHHTALVTPLDFVCTGVFSIIEFPVTQVPTGFDARGLPVGVQVAARRGNDALTLQVAAALEEDLGGWQLAEPPR